MMVLAISQQEINGNRANGVAVGANPRRSRGRNIPSRYMSPAPSTSTGSSTTASTTTTTSSTTTTSTTTTTSSITTTTTTSSSSISTRFPSPCVSRLVATTSNPNPKRSQSVDRRRFSASKLAVGANVGELPTAPKLLVTSTRSLSVSFQGEAFSLPICKAKAVNASNSCRKATPERRRAVPTRGKDDGGGYVGHGENLKPADPQQRWPARTRELNPVLKSLDCSIVDEDTLGSGLSMRCLRDSLFDETGTAPFDGVRNFKRENPNNTNSVYEYPVPSDHTASDTESVSSGSTSEALEGIHISPQQSGAGGIMVSARFWQETNMRLRRLQDSGSLSSVSPMQKMAATNKFNQARKFSDCPLTSPRSMLSPIWGAVRPTAPGTLMTPSTPSPSRGTSPSKVRSLVASSLNGSYCDTPSVLSFAVDIRRGRVGEDQIIDAHQLRLLYNRHLQWRFINARADAALSVQRRSAEKNLWNAWIMITDLRDSFRQKRTQLQLLKQKLKLASILRGQMTYLEEWSQLDKENTTSLQGAIEALKASTLRLPVVGGAVVDAQGVKEAVRSVVDVMQVIASSTFPLLTKVEELDSIVAELANTAAREQALMEQCKDILSSLSDTQVKHCSLRTHILQHNRLCCLTSYDSCSTNQILNQS